MKVYEHELYREDLAYVSSRELPWDKLRGRRILISGATGQIGSFLVDVLMYKNREEDLDCRVFAISRNEGRAKGRFEYCWDSGSFTFLEHDVNQPFLKDGESKMDYVIHLASNTHPIAYATDPIGTITANVIGLNNMLDYAVKCSVTRFLYASSNEIYGENRGDVELFDEDYCGYINCNTLRAGYPESKRCGEALCQAYIQQKGLDVVIARLTRTYGPTLLESDTKALSQFLKNAINREDVVLKSSGTQHYSYTYIADAVSGLLTVLLSGISGEAYNIADAASDVTLKELAEVVATVGGGKVVHDTPDKTEKFGYSFVTKARLDGGRLKGLGWEMKNDIRRGIEKSVYILHDCKNHIGD